MLYMYMYFALLFVHSKLTEIRSLSLFSNPVTYTMLALVYNFQCTNICFFHAVLQSELLQTQSEVRRLLERVAEASRDRSEMVSSRVHTQLIQIADERVLAAEKKSLELEREVRRVVLVCVKNLRRGNGRLLW